MQEAFITRITIDSHAHMWPVVFVNNTPEIEGTGVSRVDSGVPVFFFHPIVFAPCSGWLISRCAIIRRYPTKLNCMSSCNH